MSKKTGTSEKEIQNQCIDFLTRAGFFAWRNNMGGVIYKGRMLKNANAGAPDVLAVKGGALFCIEFKTETGTLKPHQEAWLKKARAKGAFAMVIRSLDDLIAVLDRIGAIDSGFKSDNEFKEDPINLILSQENNLGKSRPPNQYDALWV